MLEGETHVRRRATLSWMRVANSCRHIAKSCGRAAIERKRSAMSFGPVAKLCTSIAGFRPYSPRGAKQIDEMMTAGKA